MKWLDAHGFEVSYERKEFRNLKKDLDEEEKEHL